MKPLLKVALLESHDISRHGIQAVLDKAVSEVQVVNSLTSRDELERSLYEATWDILLLDDTFPRAGDINRVLSLVRRRSPETCIMVLSQRLQIAYFQQLFREGVKGFLYKGEQMEDILLPAIRLVYQGGLYLSPKAACLPYEGEAQPELEALNPRDRQVLKLLQNDLTIKEIADALNLDLQTIYRSRNKIKDVLGVRTNESIVPIAHAKGLL